ncbi:MAG: dTMP kinase [Acidimicrobiia bacterium]|nr:dTMP kinase [Acidimicrobiia bacterium]MYC57603.1 dTMP kinase [Acidimicrobiia bacterium]MYG94893.1 dTMP kinase [Acidimicrobiia bacterium]MYI31266.1 dTMP kinase [Acidimicrobiia bacterium]
MKQPQNEHPQQAQTTYKNATKGYLIAFEGGETTGKTTQARLLAERIGARLSFEPGATELGHIIRSLVLDPQGPNPNPRAEALLLAADRAQHVSEIIRPTLETGTHVVTDRYIGSSLAYQGIARGLGTDEVLALSQFATQNLACDLTVLLEVDHQTARSRQAEPNDRIEAEMTKFHRRVLEGYQALATQDPKHWVIVNGNGSVTEVAATIYAAVQKRLDV